MDLLHIIAVIILVVAGVVIYMNRTEQWQKQQQKGG